MHAREELGQVLCETQRLPTYVTYHTARYVSSHPIRELFLPLCTSSVLSNWIAPLPARRGLVHDARFYPWGGTDRCVVKVDRAVVLCQPSPRTFPHRQGPRSRRPIHP